MLDEWIKSFLSYLKDQKHYSPHTVTSYASDLGDFQNFCRGKNLPGFDKSFLEDFLAYLKLKNFSNRSIARKISTLKSFFKYLSRTGKLSEKAKINLRTPKFEQKLPSFLQERQMEDVMYLPTTKSSLGFRDRAILELFYSSGLRLAELASLKLDSINSQEGTVKVLGKRNKERIVPVGDKALEAIDTYLHKERAKLASEKHAFLFANHNGSPITARSIARIVKWYLQKVSE